MDRTEAAIEMVEKLTKTQRLLLIGKIIATILFLIALPTSLLLGGTVGLIIALTALLVDSGIVIYGLYDWINAAEK